MALSINLADEAIQLFKQQWARRCPGWRQYDQFNHSVHWLMPELLRLAQEFADDATHEQLRQPVHRLVEDLDSATQPAMHDDEAVFERYIDTLVIVVVQVRRNARARGQWLSTGDGADAAPIMCG